MSEGDRRDFPCALCGGEQREPLFTKASWRYVRCGGCGFQFVSPRRIDAVAANEAFSGAREEYAADATPARASRRTSKYARRLRRFEPYRETGRFLEVGCREGHLLAVARELGWEVTGVEPEPDPARVARERFDLDVHCGYLDTAGYPADAFDVVYLNEVIEHIPEPLPVFREIARVLRPGGVVYVKTGNCESFTARRYGSAWSYYAYDRIGHVSFYSPHTLRRLYDAAGLTLVATRTWGLEVPGRRRLDKLLRNLGLGLVVTWSGSGVHVETLAAKPAR